MNCRRCHAINVAHYKNAIFEGWFCPSCVNDLADSDLPSRSLATEVERLKGALEQVASWAPLHSCPKCSGAALDAVQKFARAALSPSTDDQKAGS